MLMLEDFWCHFYYGNYEKNISFHHRWNRNINANWRAGFC